MTFDEALQDDYCLKIMGLLERWLPKLNKSELKQLQLIALFEAVTTWDGSKSKFTTHLFNRVKFKYLKYIKHVTSKKNKPGKKLQDFPGKPNFNIDIFFDGISKKTRKILEDRFIHKYTLKHMAEERGVKVTEIKKLIENAKNEWKVKNEA